MNPYLTFLLERPCTGLIALAIVAGTLVAIVFIVCQTIGDWLDRN